jgi:hypothetical protein
MNKLTALLLFASMITASCSSTYRRAPSIDVGDHRIAISASLSDLDMTESTIGGGASLPVNTSSTSIDLTLGRVVAENFELGGILLIDNSATGSTGSESTSDMLAMGAYGRFYIPDLLLPSRKMVPWVQGAIIFAGTQETSSQSSNSASESEIFGTELSVGATHFLSENAAIEFALTQSFFEFSNFSGSAGGVAIDYDGQTIETDSTEFSVGLSLNF